MLAHEVAASLKPEWHQLADDFRRLALEEDALASEGEFERWLDLTLDLKRTHDFGEEDYS